MKEAILRPFRLCRALWLVLLLTVAAGWASAAEAPAPAGPTLRLHEPGGGLGENLVADFMYFVPLISKEKVMAGEEAGAAHRVRLLSIKRHVKAESFSVRAEFEIIGSGRQEYSLDCTNQVRRHEARLKRGGKIDRVLSAINIDGAGKGTIEVSGSVSNGVLIVNEVSLGFHEHGASPVSIFLHGLEYKDGEFKTFNEVVARVNTLRFRRMEGDPKMEVTVASVKARDAKASLWQSFKGGIKGFAVNLFIPPLGINPQGHDAMLAFGEAFASQAAGFTFPFATNMVRKDLVAAKP
jgi:hypothetical protein